MKATKPIVTIDRVRISKSVKVNHNYHSAEVVVGMEAQCSGNYAEAVRVLNTAIDAELKRQLPATIAAVRKLGGEQ